MKKFIKFFTILSILNGLFFALQGQQPTISQINSWVLSPRDSITIRGVNIKSIQLKNSTDSFYLNPNSKSAIINSNDSSYVFTFSVTNAFNNKPSSVYELKVLDNSSTVIQNNSFVRLVRVVFQDYLNQSINAWGNNANYEGIFPPLPNIIDVSAGTYHNLGLLNNGNVVQWGLNRNQLLTDSAVAIYAGNNYSVVLLANGKLEFFGDYQISLNSIPQNTTSDLISNVALGHSHILALTTSKKIILWGNNLNGKTTIPQTVNNNVQKIAAGSYHNIALLDDGTVLTWGNNDYNQLDLSGLPQTLAGSTLKITDIAAGLYSSIYLRSDSTIIIKGNVAYGDNRYNASQINSLPTKIVRIFAKGTSVFAIDLNGNVYAWGYPEYNKLSQPFANSKVNYISAGFYQNLALSSLNITVNLDTTKANYSIYYQNSAPNFLTRGTKVQVIINPKPGYFIKNLTVNGNPSDSISSITFNNIFSNQVVNVNLQSTATPSIYGSSKPIVKAGDTLIIRGNKINKFIAQKGNYLIFDTLPIIQKTANNIDTNYSIIIPSNYDNQVYAIYGVNPSGLSSNKWLFRFTNLNLDSVVPYLWTFRIENFDSTYNKFFPQNLNNVIDAKMGMGRVILLLNNGTIQTFSLPGLTNDNQILWEIWAKNQTNVVNISISSANGYGANGAISSAYILKSDGTISGFGSNVNNEISNQPNNLNNVIDIKSGTYHTIALLNDGSVRTWGIYNYPNYFTKSEVKDIVSINAGKGAGQYFGINNRGKLYLLNIDSNIISGNNNPEDVSKIRYYSNNILDTYFPLILDTLVPQNVNFVTGVDGFTVFLNGANKQMSAIGRFPESTYGTDSVSGKVQSLISKSGTPVNIDFASVNTNFIFILSNRILGYFKRDPNVNEINYPTQNYYPSTPYFLKQSTVENIQQVDVSENNGILLGKLRIFYAGDTQKISLPPSTYLKRGDSYTINFSPKTGFIIDSIFINGKYDTNKLSYTFNNIQAIQFIEIKARPAVVYISNLNQLDSLANGNYQDKYPLNASYFLTRNLNINDTNSYSDATIRARLISTTGGWTPIGTPNLPFRGLFNGNGFSISNLFLTNTTSYKGLFGYVMNSRIQDLKINANINNSGNATGILAGQVINTWVDNVSVKGTVYSSGSSIGGLIGDAQNSRITNCYSITYIRNLTQNVTSYGNLIGSMNGGIVSNCYTRGWMYNLLNTPNSSFIGRTYVSPVKIYNSYARAQMFTTQFGSLIGSSENVFDSIFFCYSSLLQPLTTGQAKQFRSLVYFRSNIPDSILAPANAYQFKPLYYPRVYKQFTQELLADQEQDSLKPSNLHYRNDTISLGLFVAGRADRTSISIGDAPIIKYSILASNLPTNQISIDSINGVLFIGNRIASGTYSITVSAANVFGQTLDTVTIFITPVVEISTINQLDSIGKFTKYLANGNYILTRDLDFNNNASYSDTTGFKGRLTSGNGYTGIENFTGSFNGNNFTISNLYQTNRTNSGLFNSTSNAIIQNLGLLNVSINNRLGAVGALVGVNNTFGSIAVTRINNCYATGNIYGEAFGVGGLIGLNSDSIEVVNSYFKGQVTGNYGVGGFIGADFGRGSRVSNCYSYGKLLVRINPAFYSGAGGFVSRIIGNSTYNNCYANVSVNIINSVNLANIYIGGSFISNFGGGSYNVQLNNCYAVDNKPFYGYLNNGIKNQFSAVVINNSISSTNINEINSTLQSSPYYKKSQNNYPLLYRLDNSNTLTLLDGQDTSAAPTDFRYNDSSIINTYQNAAELRYTPILNFGTGVNLKFSFIGSVNQEIKLDSVTGAIWWTRNLAAGVYSLQVQVSSSTGTVTTNLTLKIKDLINIEYLNQLNLIGVNAAYPANGSYRLTRNLDFDSASHYYNSQIITNFTPIGSANVPFIGYFDGSNYTISNLKSTTNGLFGYVGSNACFNNIRLINEQISGSPITGGLIGNMVNSSFGLIINNCYTTGTLSNSNSTSGYSGGLVGGGNVNALVIRNSFSLMNINGNGSGLIGRANRRVIILNSYYRGNITPTNNTTVFCGGLLGFNTGLAFIKNSYTQAQFRVTNNANLYGGLLGSSTDGFIENSYTATSLNILPLIAVSNTNTDIILNSTNNFINPSQLNYSNQFQFLGSSLPLVFYQNTTKLLDSQAIRQTYYINVQVYGGQVILKEQVQAGQIFTVFYSAPQGYTIDSVWLNGKNVDSIYGRYTFNNIQQNNNLIVKYKPITYILGIKKSEGGKVTVNNRLLINNIDSLVIPYGISGSILIEADSNYIIDTIWLNGRVYNFLATSISNKFAYLSLTRITSNNYVQINFRKISPPLKPIIDSIITGYASVSIAFSSNNAALGAETKYYRITVYPTNKIVYSVSSPAFISGLPLNTPLKFTVTAININGETVSDTSREIVLRSGIFSINTLVYNNIGGTITPSKSADLNSNQTISFSADKDYLIDSVFVNGGGVSGYKGTTTGTYVFNNINANQNIVVIFRKITYRITVQTNSTGAVLINDRFIRISGSTIVFSGDSATVTIIPNFGSLIDSIFVNNQQFSIEQLQKDDQGFNYFRLRNLIANQFIRVVFKANSYRVNISTNNNNYGYVNPQGQVFVLSGQRLIVNFVSYFGNVIDSVIVNGIAVSTNRTDQNLYSGYYLFENITGDSNIRIVFKQLYFNVRITTNNTAGGIVTPQGRVIIQRGDSLRVYIFAAARFVIDSIIVNGKAISIENNLKTYQYIFKNVSGDSNLVVKFKQIYYNINSSYIGMGEISPFGQVRILNNTDFTFRFYPIAGYHVSKLILNKKDTIKYAANSNIIGYKFNKVQADQNIVVVFDLLSVGGSIKTPVQFASEPKRYNIYSSSNEANVVQVQGLTEYDSGLRVVYNFVIPGGYRLDSVLLDGQPQPLTDSLVLTNLNADHTIRVVVTPNGKFVITTLVSTGGSIVQTGNNLLDAGSSKTITIAVDNNYQLDSVVVDGVLLNSSQYEFTNNILSYTFSNIQANHNINVILDQKLFNISFKSNTGGVLSLVGTQLVNFNESLKVDFYSNAGYRISYIKIDDQIIYTTDNSYTFSEVTANHVFEIKFEAVQAQLVKQLNINKNLFSSDTSFVETGVGKTISINALDGFSLVGVNANGTTLPLTSVTLQDGNYYYVIDNVSSDNVISFSLIQNLNINTTVTNGTITPSVGLNYGDTVKLTYRGNKGYVLSRVYKNGVDITVSSTISIDSNSGSLWYVANSNDSIRVVFVAKYFGVDFIQLAITQPVCNTVDGVGSFGMSFKRSGLYSIFMLDTASKQSQTIWTPINTSSYTINNVAPSVYKLVISDTNYPQLTRTYYVKISLPAAITTYSNVLPNQQILSLEIKTGSVGYANLNGVLYKNLSSLSQLPLQNGVNTLVLKTSETCTDSVVQTILLNEGLSLYPNPAQNYVILNVGGTDAEVTLELLSENGQVVKREDREVGSDRNVRINLEGLNAGVYIIKVQGTKSNGTLKLIKN